MPRSSEEISPKRASANGHCSRLSSSRLGEGSLPERESLSPEGDPSAFARGCTSGGFAPCFLCFWILIICLD